jgi:hypothetical protein
MFNESAINALGKYLRLLKNAMNTLRLPKVWIITLF